MNFELKIEFIAIIFILIIFWYFNIRNQDILSVEMPIENMKNISIFDGNDLNKI
jgi:hypothetical protein